MAFTMIELLLVVALVALLAMVTVPSFVQSIRGNRLRAAVRSVVAAGRYARSMSLLQSRPAELVFMLDESRIEIHLRQRMSEEMADGENPPVPEDGLTPQRTMERETFQFSPEAVEPAPVAAAFADSLRRKLDGVKIISVVIDSSDNEIGSDSMVRVVTYGSNGRCRPYQVLLEEENGDRALIKVDILGNATVEWQRR